MGDIESRSLEGFDFSNDAVENGEDLFGLLGDFSGDFLLDEFNNEVLKGGLGHFLGDDINHLLSDLFNLGSLGVGGGLELELASVSEGDGEESKEEPVAGLSVNGGLNKGVPFSDQRAEMVLGGIHSVEIGQSGSVFALRSVFNDQLDLFVGQGAGSVQVSEIDFEHSSLECLRR